MRRRLLFVIAALALSGCTPGEAIYAVFHPIGGNELVTQANQVARCESGMNPGAVSPGGGNHGMFQLNSVHAARFPHRWQHRYDPVHNATMARDLYLATGGWSHWSCRTAIR